MATEDKSLKTEKPTRKKLRDVREKGSVIRSRDIVSTAIILTVFIFFWVNWQNQLDVFKEIIVISTTLFETPFDHALTRMLDLLLSEFYLIVFPFAGIIIVVGILANVLQFGVLFSTEPLKPKVERISFSGGFKRIFSAQNLFESVKTVIKVTALSAVMYFVIRAGIKSLIQIPHCGMPCLKHILEHLAAQIAIYISPFIIALGIIDYLVQRRLHMRSHMMAKDEIKRERRDMEGDPQITAQRKQLHHELAKGGVIDAMKNATLVIASGEEIAVVLHYEKDQTPLPIITAIGRYQAAAQITDMARSGGLPIKENEGLAAGLAKDGKLDHYIPSEHITEVAQALHNAQT